jgi:hypothetical protein
VPGVAVHSLSDLRSLLGGYFPGAWFYGPDLLSLKAQRPWILPDGWDQGPTAWACPRTTKPRSRDLRHPAHESGHQPGCRIDAPGAIVLRSWTLTAAELYQYLCDEPDASITRRTQQLR